MQCYSDLNLKCCDCKGIFTSATKLLQHFVHHVHEEAKIKLKNDALSSSRRKKRAGGQTNVLESGSESSHSHTLSASSEPADTSSESSGHDQPQSCKLAKFDLQKRLETCVTEQEVTSDAYIKQEEDDDRSIGSEEVSVSPEAKVPEEYSPLKFCMITMEENDGKSSNSSPKKVASRKQLLPKKIERKVDGFRKLVPKPETMTASTELLLHSPGKKKYACHLCSKAFGWSTDLKRHILVHTGERPFQCKTCQATFTRNFLLQKHQSKVHPCKPVELMVKPEIVEMPNFIVTNSEEDGKVDPLKEEPAESNEYDDDDDEDDDKLVITEEVEEKPSDSSLSNCSSDSKWHLMSTNSERRCSDIKQSEIFGIAPMKVVTM